MIQQFEGFNAQLQVWLASLGNVHFFGQITSLKGYDLIVDRLVPTGTPAVAENRTVGFKTILSWITNVLISLNQDTLKLVAAESPLKISSMETFEGTSVVEWGNYL